MTKKRFLLWNKSPKGKVQFWTAPNGRWYWHLMVNGNVMASGDYKYRRSVRRALRRMFGPPIEETNG